jgi:plasmid stabilization system protein ParE
MAYTLHVSHLAEADLAEAIEWYEQIRPDLGASLASSIEEAINRILDNPQAFATILPEVRRALVRRFPYAVIFRIRQDRVEVEAIFHGRKDPTGWHSRLG